MKMPGSEFKVLIWKLKYLIILKFFNFQYLKFYNF